MANPSSLASRLEKTPVKVNKWNGQEVRVALDDLVAKYMTEEAQYEEHHALLNSKLIFSFLLTLVGVSTSLYAYTVPFKQSRLAVGIGAAAYFILLGVYTVWLTLAATATCFRGVQPQTKRVAWLQSRLILPEARYQLTAIDPKSGKASGVAYSWSIATCIRENGFIDGAAFCARMKKCLSSEHFYKAKAA